MLDNLGDLQRTHSCGALRPEDVGKSVTLMGWVAKRRDFGELTFIDLRDRDGVTQVVLNSEDAPEAHAKAKEVRGEYVISVSGELTLREESQRNPKLATGAIEVHARELLLLNDARTLPFQLETATSDALASEDLRLKYRYLDLRRPQLQANLRLRHRVLREIRRYMDEKGFTEIETPILIKSTPEGARDYIVPSRVQPGKFFALPQSPQLFKQLCMIAGLDKYFQIARCFRDEDLRADRQPEFTQLDVEMSFATLDQIYSVTEGLFARVFKLIGVDLPLPFPRFTYAEAMRRWGSDKPDLRIQGMELQDLSSSLEGTDFAPYAAALAAGGEVKGIAIQGGAALSRKTLDDLQEFAKRYGATGLAWIKLGDEVTSSLLKALGEATVKGLASAANAKKGDAVLIVAGKTKTVAASLGALRNELARREKLIAPNAYAPLWVTEFPMFEYHEDDDRYYAMHHPFTSPLDEDLPLLERAVEGGETALLGKLRTKAYDPVINGVELASGSIRIHRRDVQRLVFKALGMTTEEARSRFGFFLDALEFGTPPHGGIAPGIERLLMVLVPTENIRDVMAFPKTASATDLMIDAPGEVDPKQLDELSLRVVKGRELELILKWLLNINEAHGLHTFALEKFILLLVRDEVDQPSAEFRAKYQINLEILRGIRNLDRAKVSTAKPFDLIVEGMEAELGAPVQLVFEVKEQKPLALVDFNQYFMSVVGHLRVQESKTPSIVTIPILIHRTDPNQYRLLLHEHGHEAVPWVGIHLRILVREVIIPSIQQPSITEGAKSRLIDYVEGLEPTL